MQGFIDAVKALRVKIDALVKESEKLKNFPNSLQATAEITITRQKLIEAKMWLGKALEAVGQELPPEYADKSE